MKQFLPSPCVYCKAVLRYSQLKVHPWCHWHRWQRKKIFNQKSFNYFLEHLCIVELTYRSFFSFKFILRCQKSDIVPILSPILLTPVANLPPVSTTPAVTVAKFATGIVDVHLDLQISPRIFRKIPNDPNVIFSGLREDDS
jgi:hypothetical protein